MEEASQVEEKCPPHIPQHSLDFSSINLLGLVIKPMLNWKKTFPIFMRLLLPYQLLHFWVFSLTGWILPLESSEMS